MHNNNLINIIFADNDLYACDRKVASFKKLLSLSLKYQTK